MSESINARINRLSDGIDRQEHAAILSSIQADLQALAASLNQLIDDHDNATVPTTAAAVTLNTTK